MNTLRLFVFSLLISILPAAAVADDYSASGTSVFKTCTCELLTAPVIVQNTGSGINQISIKSTGQYSSWVTIVPNYVILLPGETVTATQYINPECSKAGLHEIGLYFEGNGIVKNIRQQISVAQCEQKINQTAKNPSVRVDEGLIYNLFIFTTIGLTVMLVLILVALIVRASIRNKETKVKAEPIVIQRKLRYSWEKYFKAKPSQKTEIKTEKKERSVSSTVIFIILIILAIIILAFVFWFLFQPTSIIIPGNGTNGTLYVFNASPITGI
ncbi:MAG TPA: hypothetical protein VJB90_04460 [Candidatus Nanoarchaeia archaeon]|nr:hypothetical protein [Candidatus Nanoarchaeia archaeon]